jgi:hypothetical protein
LSWLVLPEIAERYWDDIMDMDGLRALYPGVRDA